MSTRPAARLYPGARVALLAAVPQVLAQRSAGLPVLPHVLVDPLVADRGPAFKAQVPRDLLRTPLQSQLFLDFASQFRSHLPGLCRAAALGRQSVGLTVAAPARVASEFAADRRTVAAELLRGVRFAAFLQGLATFPAGQVMIAFGLISVLLLLSASPDLSATCKRSVGHHVVALQASKGVPTPDLLNNLTSAPAASVENKPDNTSSSETTMYLFTPRENEKIRDQTGIGHFFALGSVIMTDHVQQVNAFFTSQMVAFAGQSFAGLNAFIASLKNAIPKFPYILA